MNIVCTTNRNNLPHHLLLPNYDDNIDVNLSSYDKWKEENYKRLFPKKNYNELINN